MHDSLKAARASTPLLAYDHLPTNDFYERCEELVRLDNMLIPDEEGWLQIDLPAKKLEKYAKSRVSGKDNIKNIRLHLYLWRSQHMVWLPRCISFTVNDGEEQWSDNDEVRGVCFGKWAIICCV